MTFSAVIPSEGEKSLAVVCRALLKNLEMSRLCSA